jgi:hypothetical protein
MSFMGVRDVFVGVAQDSTHESLELPPDGQGNFVATIEGIQVTAAPPEVRN